MTKLSGILGGVTVIGTILVLWCYVLDTNQSRRWTSARIATLIEQAKSNPQDSRCALRLLSMARSSSSFKACTATSGLGELGDAAIPIITEIAKLLDSPNPCVSQEAAKSLAKLGIRSLPALAALENKVKKRPTDATTWFAVQAIGKIGEPANRCVSTLIEMRGTEPAMFRGVLEEAIDNIGKRQDEDHRKL